MSVAHAGHAPLVRPRFFTPGVWVVSVFAALGLGCLLYRFAFGLGATTNLNNSFPWGIWIGIDVASGVALAAGGFTTAFLVEICHRERFHALLRPALLTAAVGYTFVALGVMTDLGRFWAMWHVMLPTMWQPNSVLFEVAICVMCYLTVLYIEFLPIVCERFVGRVHLPGVLGRVNGVVDRALRLAQATLHRVILVFVVLGIVLSCMHQSSLGTLMVISQSKLHALWQTPFLPLLFILSAYAVGFPMVIFESIIAHRSLRLPQERALLAGLAAYIPFTLGVYLSVKVIDLVARRAVGHLFEGSIESYLFMAEVGLGVIAPIAIFLTDRLRNRVGWQFVGATLAVGGVMFNRLNVFLFGYTPLNRNLDYFPAWTELAITVGFVAIIVLIYRFVVLNFPVIHGIAMPDDPIETPHAEPRTGVCEPELDGLPDKTHPSRLRPALDPSVN